MSSFGYYTTINFDFHVLPTIFRIQKSRKLLRAEYIAKLEVTRKAYRILMGKLLGSDHIEDRGGGW
jgi:hypothetical protein